MISQKAVSKRFLLDVDNGGVVNPVPVNRARRTDGDILAVVDLNGPYIEKHKKTEQQKGSIRQAISCNRDAAFNMKGMLPSY